MKKTIGIIITMISIIWLVTTIVSAVIASYEYDKTISSYWELSDKASTVTQKSLQVDKYVLALKNSGLQGQHDALIFNTPDNSFDENFTALLTLQSRLHQIDTMDANSFQYNTAIQQITEQEQGQAYAMLNVFQGCWYKEHYLLLWDWIAWIQILTTIGLIITGFCLWTYDAW
jgi:nitrogen fixation/metabolism regulation signal transduction histidine kinase